LAAVLVVILIAWGAAAMARGSSSSNGGTLELLNIDTAAVDTIVLAAPRDTEVLSRSASGWLVNGYAASPERVSSLLRALTDSTAWSELVAEQPASHAEYGVATDSGRRVRVASHSYTVLDLMTGNRTNGVGGVYVRHTNGNPVYALHGALADALNYHTVDAWRNKHIAAVEPGQAATIAVQRGKHSYTLRKKDSTWTFASGDAADSAAVATLLRGYRDFRASGFATAAQADSASFTPPRLHVRMLDANGKPLVSVAFDSTTSGVWAQADSDSTVYRVDSWRLSELLPVEKGLRGKKK
jgi:hypothetical protein